MSLSRLPGPWRWERRGEKWWRIHDHLNIEDGPHDATAIWLGPNKEEDAVHST